MAEYYDWQKTFSFDAKFNIILTPRGYGKTLGLRKQMILDWKKDGSKFVVLCRHKTQLQGDASIQRGFFDKVHIVFPDLGVYTKVEGRNAYIAWPPAEGEKPEWHHFGFFRALSEAQDLKEQTFTEVRRVVFDEFAIIKNTGRRYLPGEWGLFAGCISSITREEPGKPSKARIYLLGNSVDLTNPYMRHLGVNRPPEVGYRWFNDKNVLMHVAKPSDEFRSGMKETLFGIMVAGTEEEAMNIEGEFITVGSEFVEKKPKNAEYLWGFRYLGDTYGFWYIKSPMTVYVTRRVLQDKPMYTLTLDDGSVDYRALEKQDQRLKLIKKIYYSGDLRYEDESLAQQFSELLSWLGVQ